MNKLILLDGPYAVGKTETAHCVCKISNGKYKCIDPDEYFNNNVKRYGWRGNPIPNNTLIKEDIKREVGVQIQRTNVIIPLTLNTQKYAQSWIELFQDIGEVRRVILYADKEILMSRIINDTNRQKELALDFIDPNLEYYENTAEEVDKIDTSKLNPEEVAKIILEMTQ